MHCRLLTAVRILPSTSDSVMHLTHQLLLILVLHASVAGDRLPHDSARRRPVTSRGGRPPLRSQPQVFGSPMHSPPVSRSTSREPLYKSTSLETRSRTPSPRPLPAGASAAEYYGGACLTDRSRSPSPASTTASERLSRSPRRKVTGGGGGGGGSAAGRKLPALPHKPSSLNIPAPGAPQAAAAVTAGSMPRVLPSPTVPAAHKSPGSMNFPRVNASPTRYPQTSPRPSTHRRAAPAHHEYPGASRLEGTNNLNMPPSFQQQQHQQQPRHAPLLSLDRRTNSGDAFTMRHRQQPNIPRSHSGQLHSRQHFDKDSRYHQGARHGGFRPGSIQTLPNGFKPARRAASDRPTNSDSDDDWC